MTTIIVTDVIRLSLTLSVFPKPATVKRGIYIQFVVKCFYTFIVKSTKCPFGIESIQKVMSLSTGSIKIILHYKILSRKHVSD